MDQVTCLGFPVYGSFPEHGLANFMTCKLQINPKSMSPSETNTSSPNSGEKFHADYKVMSVLMPRESSQRRI